MTKCTGAQHAPAMNIYMQIMLVTVYRCGYLPKNLQVHNSEAVTRVLCPLFQHPKLVVEECIEKN